MVQRKRIAFNQAGSNQISSPIITASMQFSDAASMNVHGLNISIGVYPLGGADPGESMKGRWYVVMLPKSIVSDPSVLDPWIANLGTSALLDAHFESAPLVWGSGAFACHNTTPYNVDFHPTTSRNAENGSALLVICVADDIDGLLDDWRSIAHITAFTSS